MDIFSRDLWDSVRSATEASFASLVSYCRTDNLQVSWDVEHFSGGVMPFESWLSLRPLNAEAPEVRVGVTYWGATTKITAEYELWRDEEKTSEAEWAPIPVGADRQLLADRLAALSDTVLRQVWADRDRVRDALRGD